MSATASLLAQIRERIRALRESGKLPGVVGFQFNGEYDGPASMTLEAEPVEVMQCDSVLGIRELLADREDNASTLLMLTSLPQAELGQDLVARLAGRRLFRSDMWAAAMNRFHAHSVDPRIAREAWIAELLLELPGNGDFPAMGNGYLDSGTVWQTLLAKLVGLHSDRPDALSLLRWLVIPGNVERYLATDQQFRDGFKRWLEGNAGEAARAVADCIEATRNSDAIAVELVLDVLTKPTPGLESAMNVSAARLERLHANRALGESAARAWADAARQLVHEKSQEARDEVAGWLRRADDLLEEIGATQYAYLASKRE